MESLMKMNIMKIVNEIGRNLTDWLKESWDILCKIVLWIIHGLPWIGITTAIVAMFLYIRHNNQENDTMMRAVAAFESIPEVVYVCTGPHSKRYHFDRHCKGLKRCSGQIIERDIEAAYEDGLRPCGWCSRSNE